MRISSMPLPILQNPLRIGPPPVALQLPRPIRIGSVPTHGLGPVGLQERNRYNTDASGMP